MTDDYTAALEAVHELLGPGPSFEGSRTEIGRKAMRVATHQLRSFQQQVDHALLQLIEQQRSDNADVRREANASRKAIADAHARIEELEARLRVMGTLYDDLAGRLSDRAAHADDASAPHDSRVTH